MNKKIIFATFFISMAFLQQVKAVFNTKDAFISLYKQQTEILFKDTVPYTKSKFEIIFKFNSENAIATFHNYSVFYSHFDELKDLNVYTINPTEKGKTKVLQIKNFEVSHSTSRGVFYDDQQEVGINFLGLVVGSEAHVEYTVITKEMHFTDAMVFKSFLPIQNEIYELTVPQNIALSFIEKNVPANFVNYSKKLNKSETIHTWQAQNVDEEKAVDNAPARLWYTPHILYKVDEFTVKNKKYTYSKTPTDLFNWYKNHIADLRKTPTEKLQLLADSITKKCSNNTEKIKTIFNWVQANVRYVAFENGMEGLIPREAELVCNRRYGDCKDMANLSKTLLDAVKIPAYLASIGTRSLPYTYSEVPLKNADNHMICAVKVDGKYVYLDATDSKCTFGLPTSHIQGKQALIYTGANTYDLETVPVIDANINLVQTNYILDLQENNILVKASSKYKGMHISNMANKLQYLTKKDLEEFAKGTVKLSANNAILTKYTVPEIANLELEPLKFEYKIENHCKEVGNEKYVNIFMYKNYLNDAIKDATRTEPIELGNNVADNTSYILNIPANYKASYVPENVNYTTTNFACKIEYIKTDKIVTCNINTICNLPNLMLQTADFTNWNKFIKTLNTAYKESIILEKIN